MMLRPTRDRRDFVLMATEELAPWLHESEYNVGVALFATTTIKNLDATIQQLARRGCAAFLCVGESSEQLHDEVDDSLIGIERLDVVTTWHRNEPPDEVANFFLAGRLAEHVPGAMLAVVDDDEEGKPLREALLSHPHLVECKPEPS